MIVDLRSDTVTRPTQAMREAMATAVVGDDVYGDDPTVEALETGLAARLGFEAGLFVPSGTQSNLLALLTHCERGDEYIATQDAHCYRYEAGGAAVVGGIQPQPVAPGADGQPDPAAIEAAIKPDDPHFARTRLVCIENTKAGQPLDPARQAAIRRLCTAHGLALHLDGARLFNAAAGSGTDAARLTAGCDSASVCLSKGLGAPVGSVLLGRADFVARARRLRKMLGGGMRQAGILAAAGLHALEHHVARLAEDHARAERLARGLAVLPAFEGHAPRHATNMVFLTQPLSWIQRITAELADADVLIHGRGRLVTHLDVDDDAVDRALAAFARLPAP